MLRAFSHRILVCFCISPIGLLLPSATHAADAETVEGPQERAAELVRVALQYGVRGDQKYRNLLLKAAIREDPQNESARWAAGQIKLDDRWHSISDLKYRDASDPIEDTYREKRSDALDSAVEELKLARWCDRNHQPELAKIHYRRVIDRTDATESQRRSAIDRLGLRMFAGRLLPEVEIKRLQSEYLQGQKNVVRWSGKLQRWQRAILSGTRSDQTKAFAEMQKELDETAIPALELNFSLKNPKLASTAVSLLSEMDSPAASESLARHAVAPEWDAVRKQATIELKKRPLHEYMPTLMSGLSQPMQTVFRIVPGRSGRVIHEHLVIAEAPDQKYVHRLRSIGVPELPTATSFSRGGAEAGLMAQLSTIAQVGNRARAIEQQVAGQNRRGIEQNSRANEVLESVTHHSVGSPSEWWDWWKDYNDVEKPELKPTTTVAYNETYRYRPTLVRDRRSCECFPAGTSVWTRDGQRPIESIKAGDQVLARAPESGEIAFKYVRDVTVRTSTPMVTLGIGNLEMTSTKGHPIWVEGHGWKMSKLIQIGERVHTLNGTQEVSSIKQAPNADAYNLVVADFATYFVTEVGILVHDNSYRKPTRMISPGFAAK